MKNFKNKFWTLVFLFSFFKNVLLFSRFFKDTISDFLIISVNSLCTLGYNLSMSKSLSLFKTRCLMHKIGARGLALAAALAASWPSQLVVPKSPSAIRSNQHKALYYIGQLNAVLLYCHVNPPFPSEIILIIYVV